MRASRAQQTTEPEPALRDVPVPPCRLVENDNGGWDGNLPYEFDILTQEWVELSHARGGLSQELVACLIGVTHQRVSEIERIALRKLRKRHGQWLQDFLLDIAARREIDP